MRTLAFRSAIFLPAAALLLLSACKGRTAENVTPTGDTVELDVEIPVEDDDTIILTTDSITNEN